MPYRLDLRGAGEPAFDRLVDLGALDVEISDGGVAALMPDRVRPQDAAHAAGAKHFAVSPPPLATTDRCGCCASPRSTSEVCSCR